MSIIHGGATRAWVNFNGASFATNDSFNVSGMTDHGAGTYTVTYSANFGNANNSPVIKIRAGQTLDSGTRQITGKSVKENIDTDASSIYLTSDGLRDIKFDNQQITGKKILIKSDGIFIKGNDIRLGSGVSGNLEPVVKGNELKKLLDQVFTATISTNQTTIVANQTQITTLTATGTPPAIAQATELQKQNAELVESNAQLQLAIDSQKYLSENVKTI